MREHCHYCNKPLYKLYMQMGLYSHVDDTDDYRDTKGHRMCAECDQRLLREGHAIQCPVCQHEIYALKQDQFKEKTIKREHLRGIPPQPDPYLRAFLICRSCKNQIKLMLE